MTPDPRQKAIQLFLNWEKTGHTLDACIQLQQHELNCLSHKDRRLFNAIVFGVYRHRSLLDWMIKKHSNHPVHKIKLPVLYILRTGMIQLYLMEKIPDFAAIDTSVTLARRYSGKKAAGFVNAVLRSTTRDRENMAYPEHKTPGENDMQVKYSFPAWLSRKWIKQFGFDQAFQLARHISTIPDITLRVNPMAADSTRLFQMLEPICKNSMKTEFASLGIRISGPKKPLHETDAFKNGWFQMQDEAAQIVSEVLGPRPEENILDTCAGLGGKTIHMAQLMQNTGAITAVDIDTKKLDILKEEAIRLGITTIQYRALDILKSSIKNFDGYFDRVLVDAPCSGLGVLRRNPDAKWRRKKADINRLSAKQKKILNAAANLTSPGGILVYAVCSCEKEENEDTVFSFLSKRKDFSIDNRFESGKFNPLMTRDGFIKTYPSFKDMDGFFVARLKRKVAG